MSHLHSFVFSDWRRTVSLKFFDPQVPSISTKELVLPRHARCILSRLRCNGLGILLGSISLGLAESRILPAAPAYKYTRPRTPLISFCTVQLWTLCAVHSLVTLCLFTISALSFKELPGFWDSMVFRYAPIPRKGLGSNNNMTCPWRES